MRYLIFNFLSVFFFFVFSLSLSAQDNTYWETFDWDDVVDGDGINNNYGSAQAIRIAENVLLYQRNYGGWPKNTDMHLILTQAEKDELIANKPDNSGGYSTIDNKAVKLELTYLSRVYEAIPAGDFKTEVKSTFLNGVQYLLNIQFDNGGWPQFYPFRSADSYSNHITYNDNAMVNVLNILRHIYQKDSEYSIIAADSTVAAAKIAFDKGIECILNTQYRQNGLLTVWCAQHDYKTLVPVKARSYELASLSGGESSGIIGMLMSLDNPSNEIKRAVYYAVKWYDETRIEGYRVESFTNADGLKDRRVVADANASDMWARFYTLEENTPFFCDRDGIKKYSLAEIDYERRNGYSWYGGYGFGVLDEYTNWYPKWGTTIEQETIITSPEFGTSSLTSDEISVNAFTDEFILGSIQKFELFVDDILINDFVSSKIDTVLTDLPVGTHSIIAKATYNNGHVSADTSEISVEAPATIGNANTLDKAISCFPNPTTTSFSIGLENIGASTIEMYSLRGQLVYKAVSTDSVHSINVQTFTPGVYFIKVVDLKRNVYTYKLMVK